MCSGLSDKVLMMPIVKRELKSGAYDIIQLEHTNIAHWLKGVRILIPKVIVAHKVKSVLYLRYWKNATDGKKSLMQREYLRFLKFERDNLPQYDCVVAMSETDKGFIRQLYGENIPVTIVQNGVDTDYYQITRHPAELVFVGTMNYEPNDEAALYFCDKIFPLILEKNPSVNFSIVGKDPDY